MSNLYLISNVANKAELELVNSIALRKINSFDGWTRINYESRWRTFRNWYEAEGKDRSLLRFTPLDVDDFFNWFKARKGFGKRLNRELKVSDTTCKQFAQTMYKLWEVILQDRRITEVNPWRESRFRFKRTAKSHRRKTELTPYDMRQKLIEAPDPTTLTGLRDRAILAALYGGALRRVEVVNLNFCDVIEVDDYVKLMLVATKNRNDDLQSISAEFASYIIAYKKARTLSVHSPDEPFFIRYIGARQRPVIQRMSDDAVYSMFKRTAKEVGLPSSISPHSARKTSITYLLDNEVSHRKVAIFSRHSSVAMVEEYDAERKSQHLNPFAQLRLKD